MKNNNPFLINFFTLLEKNAIEYCILRNYQTLPHSAGNSDIDILVMPDDLKKFYEIFDISLNNNGGKIIIQYGKLTPRICVAGTINNEYYGIQFDVHEGILPYQDTNMYPVESIFNNIKIYNNIKVADDNDSDILAFLKEIFHNGFCKEKYFLAAKKVWLSNNKYKNELRKIYTNEFINMFEIVIQNDYDINNIKKLSLIGRKNLKNGIKKKLSNIKSKFYRFFKTPGFTIAILGTDGAGKTTIINNIREPLNEAVHNSFYYEHMRPNLIPNIAQLFNKSKNEGPVTNPHQSKTSGFFGSLVRICYYSFDYTIGYLIKVYPVIVKKSSIWVFDRYYYDYIIDPKRARLNLPEWLIKGIKNFIPRPNLIICLGATPEIIFERKPELPLDEITRQVNKLKEFAKKEKNAIWVDTDKSIKYSTEEVFKIIIKKMSERYN